MQTFKNTLRSFRDDDYGGITAWGLLIFASMAALGATALDVSYLMSTQGHMQIAADSAAHAALYTRDTKSEAQARAAAIDLVEAAFPPSKYGQVLTDGDIEFGTWDKASASFTAGGVAPTAVRVTTSRRANKMNAVPSFLFRMVGIDAFDVATTSVFETFRPMCLTEGFVADGVVDIQSNNTYTAGFCLHGNDHISLNSNNVFEEGTIVSMPNIDDVDLPRSGYETNPGLAAALRTGSYRLRVVNRLESIINGLLLGDLDVIPDYIDSVVPTVLLGNRLDAGDFMPGRIHYRSCFIEHLFLSKGKITIKNDTLLEDVVLVTDCEVKFEQGVRLENAIVATTHTGARSINAPSTLTVGRNDGCAAGGGAKLLTMGSMEFAADLHIYGGQLIAKDDITFSANANGIQGASMVAGGDISGTSNMEMGYCGSGMDDNFEDDYFRMVQ